MKIIYAHYLHLKAKRKEAVNTLYGLTLTSSFEYFKAEKQRDYYEKKLEEWVLAYPQLQI